MGQEVKVIINCESATESALFAAFLRELEYRLWNFSSIASDHSAVGVAHFPDGTPLKDAICTARIDIEQSIRTCINLDSNFKILRVAYFAINGADTMTYVDVD